MKPGKNAVRPEKASRGAIPAGRRKKKEINKMAIGKNIVKNDKLIKDTTEKKTYQPGEPSKNPGADTFGTRKQLFYFKIDLYERLRNYVYWTPGATITNTANQAIAEFLKGKNTKPIPGK